ncbi:MAG: hypothetical protein WA771_08620 [Chthoniobacterales bacterium]
MRLAIGWAIHGLAVGVLMAGSVVGEEISLGPDGEMGPGAGSRPQLVGRNADEILREYREAEAGGPNTFGFGEEGRVETTSRRIAILEELDAQAAVLGEALVEHVSREILGEGATTANERVVAIRNVTFHSAEGAGEAGEALARVLGEPGLAERAPFAYLQALDGVVYLKDAGFVPRLAELAERGAGAEAARLGLHQLATVAPVGVMRQLNEVGERLAGLPGIRADIFAAGHPGNAEALAEMETYLSRGDVSTEEKVKMLKRLPQPAFVVTDGIFTRDWALPKPPPGRAGAVEKALADWAEREEFRELWEEIWAVRQSQLPSDEMD